MLPAGVSLVTLTPHQDERGVFIELFRASWQLDVGPAQWNAVSSAANVLRGVHAHWRHADYLTVIAGHMILGLHDLRELSPTSGMGTCVELRSDAPAAITIPPGVAHGFYVLEPSIHIYAVSHEWDPADELGCRWDDRELGIVWPCADPVLSERDASLGTLSELRESVQAALVML